MLRHARYSVSNAVIVFTMDAQDDMVQCMRLRKITDGGQISLPADVRHRWGTRHVGVEDLGDRLVITPVPDDPIVAARGALKGRISSAGLREQARKDEAAAEVRR